MASEREPGWYWAKLRGRGRDEWDWLNDDAAWVAVHWAPCAEWPVQVAGNGFTADWVGEWGPRIQPPDAATPAPAKPERDEQPNVEMARRILGDALERPRVRAPRQVYTEALYALVDVHGYAPAPAERPAERPAGGAGADALREVCRDIDDLRIMLGNDDTGFGGMATSDEVDEELRRLTMKTFARIDGLAATERPVPDPAHVACDKALDNAFDVHGYAPAPSEPVPTCCVCGLPVCTRTFMTNECGALVEVRHECNICEARSEHGAPSEPAAAERPAVDLASLAAMVRALPSDPDSEHIYTLRGWLDFAARRIEESAASERPAGEREEVERLSEENSRLRAALDQVDDKLVTAFEQDIEDARDILRAHLDSLQPSGMEERVREKLGLGGEKS